MDAQKPITKFKLPLFTLMKADHTGLVLFVHPTDKRQTFLLLFTTGERAEEFRERVGWPTCPVVVLRTPEEITDTVIEQIRFHNSRRANMVAVDPVVMPDGQFAFDGFTVEQFALINPIYTD